VLLTEIVVDPQQDWNDSGAMVAAGVPFDSMVDPTAKPSATDEWAELRNLSTFAVDVTDYVVEVDDRNHSSQRVGDAWAARQVYPRTDSLLLGPGAYLVVRLSPPGESAADTALVTLRDPHGFARDSVQLGEGSVPSGKASGVGDEAVALCGGEWRKTRATPGESNACE
jgi:hypothetical protein